MKMKHTTKFGQIILNVIFIIISCMYIIPFMLLISISISNEGYLKKQGYSLIPRQIDFEAYKQIFRNPNAILDAYGVTIIFTVMTVLLGVIIMCMAAYPLSRKNCKFRNAFSFYLFFTMLFSGGLVPSYIINSKYLHIDNTIWVYILPGIMSAWYTFIIRSFFQGLPNELIEAAKIDGASETRVLMQLIIPLSTPVIATIAFNLAIGKWNDWNTALIYIRNPRLYSLQYLLQKILNEAEFLENAATQNYSGNFENIEVPTESMRYAMAILAAGPMMFIFPFFQKYFTQGLTVGSVKG